MLIGYVPQPDEYSLGMQELGKGRGSEGESSGEPLINFQKTTLVSNVSTSEDK
jgi:hypothetical protein